MKLFASPTTLQEFEDYDFQVRMRCGTDPATLIESATTEGTVTTEGTRQFSLTFTQAGNPIPVQGEIEEGQIAILTLTLLPGEQVYSTDIDFKVGFQDSSAGFGGNNGVIIPGNGSLPATTTNNPDTAIYTMEAGERTASWVMRSNCDGDTASNAPEVLRFIAPSSAGTMEFTSDSINAGGHILYFIDSTAPTCVNRAYPIENIPAKGNR